MTRWEPSLFISARAPTVHGGKKHMRYQRLLICTLQVICFQAYAGDLVAGLERTNSFLITDLVPVLSLTGLIIAAIFLILFGREGVSKCIYTIGGTALLYFGSGLIEQTRVFFWR
jgi:hypothetical protein